MGTRTIINIVKKEGNYNSAGDEVTFDEEDGTLSINLYDGYTKLNKEEALAIAKALTDWAEKQ